MAAGGHFGCPKITFDLISIHFTSIRNFNFFLIFDKMADIGHFGCPNFTFDRISGHFRSICNFNFFFEIFDKMAVGRHFGCPKFTFDHISGHFRSIPIFFRRPFWMSENHFGSHFCPFQFDRPFWMSEIHFRWDFWPFQIHTEHYLFFDKMTAGGHFGWDDNVNYRTRPIYLDE